MDTCRNCGAATLRELGFIGKIAPFFLKRVYHLEMRVPRSPHRWKQMLRTLGRPVRRLCEKLYSNDTYLEMQICAACSFVQAKHPFAEEAITRLYVDYRSETYNGERTRYEPSYAAIAARVGTDRAEVETRLKLAEAFLAGKIAVGPGFTMLDYGGSDGRFLPALSAARFVYEISDVPPVAGVKRVATVEDQYSYVHLAHVLEHVVRPLELVRSVAAHVEPGGYLYIEVPQELTDERRDRMMRGEDAGEVGIHEHINCYSATALTRLMEAAGLEVVGVQGDTVDLGWVRGVHLRALGRKR